MRASYPKSLVLPSTLDFSTEVVSVQALHVSFVFKKYPFAHTIRDTALSFAILQPTILSLVSEHFTHPTIFPSAEFTLFVDLKSLEPSPTVLASPLASDFYTPYPSLQASVFIFA